MIGPSALSKREIEVATLLAQGFSSKEIAEQLHISVYTADTHRTNIYKRLRKANATVRIDNLAKLTRWAMTFGLVEPYTEIPSPS